MKQYYSDDYCTIYHADCREVLPQLEAADCILTDPPYGIDGEDKAQFRSGTTVRTDYVNDHFSLDWLPLIQAQATAAAFIFHDQKRAGDVWLRALESGWSPKQFVVWDKGDCGVNPRGNFVNAWEMACYIARGQPWKGGGAVVNIFRKNRQKARRVYHPSEKPVELLQYLLQTVGHSLVIDPFMGSGSTLRAAKNLNTCAIGIELEEQYCEIAAQRLSQEVFDFDATAAAT